MAPAAILACCVVMWPDFGDDVAVAVAWVIEHADALGVDRSRVALMGHSAGAHLVTVVSVHPELLAGAGISGDDVACVVALDSASYDLTAEGQDERVLIRSAFGTDPAALTDASPIHHLGPSAATPPDMLVVARGRPTRVQTAEDFAAAARAAGGSTQVLDATPYTHEEVNTRLGAADDAVVTPGVDRFLAECLA